MKKAGRYDTQFCTWSVQEDCKHAVLKMPFFFLFNKTGRCKLQLYFNGPRAADPFLVREGDCKLNFIPLKHLIFTYDSNVPPAPFNAVSDF